MADNPQKPYGEVTYADPGHQDDKKKRYPLDTEAHVRAAWSYINQGDNAATYSAEQLASIKSKIKAAAKKMGIEISDSEKRSDDVSILETRSANVADVNVPERIVTIIAAPYGEAAQVLYRREVWNEVFARSAFQGIETRQKPIPAVAALEMPDSGHRGRIVGRVVRADPSRPEGLVTDIKISRTELGNEALELALDNALSASVGFMIKDRLDETLNRATRTRTINRAFLDHIALVGSPAYSGAKILAVRSDGSATEADLPPLPSTPLLDQYRNDPLFKRIFDSNQ